MKSISIIDDVTDKRREKKLDVIGTELFLTVGKKLYRFTIDEEDNIILSLTNGCDVKIVSCYGYPSIKLIGQRLI